METDPELQAMASAGEILAKLSPDSAARVLRWLNDKFGVELATAPAKRDLDPIELSVAPEDFKDLAGFFVAAAPSTETEKALVVGFWLQNVQGNEDLDAQQVNAELKHLGHGVGNITRAFDRLKGQRPQLAIQTRKSGVSKQSRKKYRITTEGVNAVKEMLRKVRTGEG